MYRATASTILVRVLALALVLTVTASAQVGFQKADYATDANPVKLVTADFNYDGIPDLATANAQGNSVSILLGNSDGTFRTHVDYPVGAGPHSLVVADFNNDGKPDLVVTDSTANAISILLGNGDGTFTVGAPMAAGIDPTGVAVGDFNKDGNADIAIADHGDGAVLILLGTGTGIFTVGQQLKLAASPQGYPSPPTDVIAADLNGDGILDLGISACCNGPDVTWGELHIATGKGDGTFTDQLLRTYPGGYDITAADLNRDGLADLVDTYAGCHTPCIGVDVEINGGGGKFTSGNAGNQSTLQYGAPYGAAVADINGDGNPDIVVPFTAGGDEQAFGKNLDKVIVLLGKGDGTFSPQLDFAVGAQTGPMSPVVADFNHDGKPDIAVVDSRTKNVTILLNVSGTAAAAQDFAFTTESSSRTVSAGQTASYSAYAEALNGTLPTLTVTCSGLPQGAACSTQYLTGSPIAEGILNVTTTARTSGALRHSSSPFGSPFTWFAVILPIGLVTSASGKRNCALYIAILAVVALACFQIGCGGATNASPTNSATTGSTNSGTNGSSSSGGGTSTTGSGSSSGSTGSGSSGSGTSTGTGTTGGSGSGTGTGGSGTGTGTGSGGSGTGTGGSGSGGSTSSGTPAGSYTVTVEATGANGLAHSATVTLVVQ